VIPPPRAELSSTSRVAHESSTVSNAARVAGPLRERRILAIRYPDIPDLAV
jgi:hypothetical protein